MGDWKTFFHKMCSYFFMKFEIANKKITYKGTGELGSPHSKSKLSFNP